MEIKREFFTTEEIADRLGIDVQTVRRWIREGRIKAHKLGKSYIITEVEFKRITGQNTEEDNNEQR